MDLIQALAAELGKDPRHVENVVHLLDEGNTIPFIARYRKELHGAMDDTSLRTLEERLQYLRGLEERREAVKKSIDEQGKLTDELAAAIDSAKTLAEVEDLYRPYKQKRRTRATMAKEKGLEPLADVKGGRLADLPDRVKAYGEDKAAGEIGVGVPTLRDIVSELLKPGRDVRDELPKPILRTDVLEMKDLKPGMVLTGTVRNVIDFGVFVDIGVHQDGLVHISQVSNKFIKHPSEVVSVGDVVKVVVLEVNEKKKRISLSMKQAK